MNANFSPKQALPRLSKRLALADEDNPTMNDHYAFHSLAQRTGSRPLPLCPGEVGCYVPSRRRRGSPARILHAATTAFGALSFLALALGGILLWTTR